MDAAKALVLINNFGVEAEYELVKADMLHEAYQIRHARYMLNYALLESVETVYFFLERMTTYTVDKFGEWHYDPILFVMDERTRALLENFNIALTKVFL
jgi:hypothetical protein